MSTLSQDSWRAISAYLDQALELPRGERAFFVASVREHDEALVPVLEKLLHEHDEVTREAFLEVHPEGFPSDPLVAGAEVGAYTLVSHIGQGGMGTVWLAERNDGRFK